MLAFNQNYNIDAFLFPLDAYYLGRHKEDTELSSIVARVEAMARLFAQSNQDVKMFVDAHLDTVFDFRMIALKWLAQNETLLPFIHNYAQSGLSDFKDNPQFDVLYQNVLFAIRVNLKGFTDFMGTAPQSDFKLADLSAVPQYTFTGFLNFISLTMPHSVTVNLIDWMMSSLYIEFSLITVFIIHKEKLPISTTLTDNFAAFIADAAQEFGALSSEMKPKAVKKHKPLSRASLPFLAEQTFLAEQDVQLLSQL